MAARPAACSHTLDPFCGARSFLELATGNSRGQMQGPGHAPAHLHLGDSASHSQPSSVHTAPTSSSLPCQQLPWLAPRGQHGHTGKRDRLRAPGAAQGLGRVAVAEKPAWSQPLAAWDLGPVPSLCKRGFLTCPAEPPSTRGVGLKGHCAPPAPRPTLSEGGGGAGPGTKGRPVLPEGGPAGVFADLGGSACLQPVRAGRGSPGPRPPTGAPRPPRPCPAPAKSRSKQGKPRPSKPGPAPTGMSRPRAPRSPLPAGAPALSLGAALGGFRRGPPLRGHRARRRRARSTRKPPGARRNRRALTESSERARKPPSVRGDQRAQAETTESAPPARPRPSGLSSKSPPSSARSP